MTIFVKNKETLILNDFIFKCSIGKKGLTKDKHEGDNKTPMGLFNIGNLYFRSDKHKKPKVRITCIPIKKNISGKGSAIFIHITDNYKPTQGCIALKKNDFLILIKLINKKTKIKIS